ncbi:hypothetical protein I553_7221 [Mycobacterium xenopi 4042]|uniref:Uncharacterized protein n=1 Tax=Mycobacterium xenopi 4042 TaxID=1299334 RepID=X7Z409_MYCXE|nr:hypothetical protein I553_7221 [Mycobacterium xenopi 4042]
MVLSPLSTHDHGSTPTASAPRSAPMIGGQRCGGHVDPYPDALATWPRSATSPSDTSIIACAPALAAARPCP